MRKQCTIHGWQQPPTGTLGVVLALAGSHAASSLLWCVHISTSTYAHMQLYSALCCALWVVVLGAVARADGGQRVQRVTLKEAIVLVLATPPVVLQPAAA
jgi:hypothetical protein